MSVNSKPDHPPGRRPGIFMFSLPGGQFLPNFLCPGSQGFELEKFPTVWKVNAGFSRFVSKKQEQFEKQVLFHNNFCKNSRCLLCL